MEAETSQVCIVVFMVAAIVLSIIAGLCAGKVFDACEKPWEGPPGDRFMDGAE